MDISVSLSIAWDTIGLVWDIVKIPAIPLMPVFYTWITIKEKIKLNVSGKIYFGLAWIAACVYVGDTVAELSHIHRPRAVELIGTAAAFLVYAWFLSLAVGGNITGRIIAEKQSDSR